MMFRISEEDLLEAKDFIATIRESGDQLTLSELIRNGIKTEIAYANNESQAWHRRLDADKLYDAVSEFFRE